MKDVRLLSGGSFFEDPEACEDLRFDMLNSADVTGYFFQMVIDLVDTGKQTHTIHTAVDVVSRVQKPFCRRGCATLWTRSTLTLVKFTLPPSRSFKCALLSCYKAQSSRRSAAPFSPVLMVPQSMNLVLKVSA